MQDYEASVSFLGTWGPFQRRASLLLCLTAVPTGYNLLSVIFLLANPAHHCRAPAHANLSQEWAQAGIPLQAAGPSGGSSCSWLEVEAARNLSASGLGPDLDQVQNRSEQGWSPEVVPSGLRQEGCKDGWTYDTEYYQSTVVTEFNLVCDHQWKQPLTSLAYFIGGFCGCFLSGQISDRFGRKPVLFGAIAILIVFSSAVAFAPSWPVFTVLFFMLGMGQMSSYIVGFVLGSELLIGSPRILFSTLFFPCSYVMGTLLLPGTAYLVRSWRHLSLIMAVPGLACIPLWWLVPESPRWLVSRGRLQDADLLLRSAALENRVDAPPVIFVSASAEKAQSQTPESLGFLDLLRTTNIRLISFILWTIWFSVNVSYFGLSFNTSSLYGNPFLNYFLLTAVELPAYAVGCLAARKLPRRLSFTCLCLMGALSLLLIQLTLQSQPALTLSLVLLGKFGVLAASGILYIYTGELSPTGIRNTAMASSATFARVGSAISPYLLQLAVFNQFLPWIVVGCLSLLSMALCIFLPETFGQTLPDTIEQVPQARFSWPWACDQTGKDKEMKDQTTLPEIICTSRL